VEVKLLLDTQIVVWLALDSTRLRPDLIALLSTHPHISISVVSRWELGIKAKQERFNQLSAVDSASEMWGFETLPIHLSHAKLVSDLPLIHRDPFDRMLVAQAIAEGMTLVTSDATLAAYNLPVLMA
jgi:PIN domain nuclease of toxin-antitoxin system